MKNNKLILSSLLVVLLFFGFVYMKTYNRFYFMDVSLNELNEICQSQEDELFVVITKEGCPFCKDYIPKFEDKAKENNIKTAYRINLSNLSKEDSERLMEKWGIEYVPTTLLIKKNKILTTLTGNVKLSEIDKFMQMKNRQ
ncbi:thioredoxin family protein [Erysipelotrichaceae bacterium HCN-30851]